jgi:triphosphoribosyl-dephospho-CoA synthase
MSDILTYTPLETINSEPTYLASMATQALIAEAELTPKPGLVDRRGPGARTDLSLDLMKRSALTLEPYFTAMAEVSALLPIGRDLRAQLCAIGREAEHAMYKATGGINTHKGAIWALGLLIAAPAHSNGHSPVQIAKVAGCIARMANVAQSELVSHRNLVRNRYGATGERGEAYANFPHVTEIGIPALKQARQAGQSESASRLVALLSIMATLEDTSVLYCSGGKDSEMVKKGARSVIAAGGPGTLGGAAALRDLESELLARRISPGGSADLLAATLFLDSIELGARL